jgi:hypothetical protein
MNLGIGHPEGGDPPLWIDATEFAEVVYRSNDVLVVSVATDLAEDSLLTGALMDVIATADQCDMAESAIATLASELDLELETGDGFARGERHLTIAPRPAAAPEPAPSVRP